MKLHFFKYQGTGNDFILLDNRSQSIALTREQVKFLCDRRFGIGADGLMLLETEAGYDFKMVYFNSDGNESSMCGNGGRCLMAFAHRLGVVGEKGRFIAVDGPHDAVILEDGSVSLKMQDVKGIETGIDFFYLNTGSPHYVKIMDALQDVDVKNEGRKIRYNERFAQQGTNVNFIEKKEDALFVRTYERGVEDETLSCGTGVTAAALVAAVNGLSTGKNQCRVLTPGGVLNVKFDKVLENTFYNIWLEGSATFVYEGTITIDT